MLTTQLSDANSILISDVVVGSDETLKSICQFDVLVSLISLHDSGNSGFNAFYPHSSQYYSQRTDGVMDLFIESDEFRTALGFDDLESAKQTMRSYISWSDQERIRFRMLPEPRPPRVNSWLEVEK